MREPEGKNLMQASAKFCEAFALDNVLCPTAPQ